MNEVPLLPVEDSGPFARLRENARGYNHLTRAAVRIELQIQSVERSILGKKSKKAIQEARGHRGTDLPDRLAPILDGPQDWENGGDLLRDDSLPPTVPSAPDSVSVGKLSPKLRSKYADRLPFFGTLLDVLKMLHKTRKPYRVAIEQIIFEMPIWEQWASAIPGIGPIILGLILAETGDLSNYDGPAKVWKRMGVGLVDGKIQRRIKARTDLKSTKAQKTIEAIKMGYSPHRRSIMHQLGKCLVMQNFIKSGTEKTDGELRKVYVDRKAYELTRDPKMKPIIAHKRAMRYTEKRFLRDLWRAWRKIYVESNEDVTICRS